MQKISWPTQTNMDELNETLDFKIIHMQKSSDWQKTDMWRRLFIRSLHYDQEDDDDEQAWLWVNSF